MREVVEIRVMSGDSKDRIVDGCRRLLETINDIKKDSDDNDLIFWMESLEDQLETSVDNLHNIKFVSGGIDASKDN